MMYAVYLIWYTRSEINAQKFRQNDFVPQVLNEKHAIYFWLLTKTDIDLVWQTGACKC